MTETERELRKDIWLGLGRYALLAVVLFVICMVAFFAALVTIFSPLQLG